MNSAKFRKELINIMPRYVWTVHRIPYFAEHHLSATGIQSSGFNRLSTLKVTKFENKDGEIGYDVKTAGFGKKAPWLSTYTDKTLARALRGLQNHYEIMAREYSKHAGALEFARKKHIKSEG